MEGEMEEAGFRGGLMVLGLDEGIGGWEWEGGE